jgi:hypothetical protein
VVEIKKLPAAFFCTAAGNEPVREWLKSLDEADRRRVGEDIATAEFGWPVGMPICRSLGSGLYEIRSDISHRRITRVIFCVAEEQWFFCMGSSRRRKRRQRQTLTWH